MRGRRLRRGGAAAGAVVLAAAVVLSVVPEAMASAPAKSVTCTSLSGTLEPPPPVTFVLSGCSGNTEGTGRAQGSTITWKNGLTTYLTSPAFTPSGKPRKGDCPAQSDKWTVADAVGGDSTGSIKVGGKVSAKVCIRNEVPDPWSLAPGSVFTLR